MASKILALLIGEAEESNTEYSAAPSGYMVRLGYKDMKDPKTGKSKGTPPKPFVACLPMLELPTCGNAALDTILKATMEGYAESLLRKLRTEEGEADSIEFDPSDFALDAIVAHAEEKASSMKMSEATISAWWKAEGQDACTASYIAATGKAVDDPAVGKAVANIAVLFLKLSAPVVDILPELCEVMLSRIAVLEVATSTTQAIRRKLEKRVEDAKKARTLLLDVGPV